MVEVRVFVISTDLSVTVSRNCAMQRVYIEYDERAGNQISRDLVGAQLAALTG